MLKKLINFQNKYQIEISWFFIGSFIILLAQDVAKDNILETIADIILILTNYHFYKTSTNR